MRKFLSALAFLALMLTTAVAGAPGVFADDSECRGVIGAEDVDAVVVPAGATCTLLGTDVDGDVTVKAGATLKADGVEVDGSVQAQGHALVHIFGDSFIQGSIQIQQGDRAVVEDSEILGDVQAQQNTGSVRFSRNRVDGQMQASQNTGGLVIENNVIANNLQCQQNNPAPTGGNNVADDKEGQCEEL